MVAATTARATATVTIASGQVHHRIGDHGHDDLPPHAH
jgi:hypothetical protein